MLGLKVATSKGTGAAVPAMLQGEDPKSALTRAALIGAGLYGITMLPGLGAAGAAGPVQLSGPGYAGAGAAAGAGEAAGGLGGLGGILSNPSTIGSLLGGLGGLLGGNKKGGDVETTMAPWGPQQPYLQALFPGATGTLDSVIRGNYLTPESNPYLKQYGQALSDQVGAAVDSRFALGGRYGSGAHAGEVAKQVGNSLAGLYGGAYGNERALQNNAALGIMGQRFGTQTSQPYYENPLSSALSGALAGSQLGKWW